jgi:carbon-monoxide dehydrogenase medium subunit
MEGEIRPLPRFEYFAPTSLDDVVALLGKYQDGSRLLAGGTDLLLNMKKRTVWPAVVVDLNKVPGLSFVETRGNNVHIGALTRLNDIKDSAVVRGKVSVLAEAIALLAANPIRNRASIGGNLCNASPAADTAPPLLALKASVKLRGPKGERIVTLSEFFLGPGQTARKADEVLTEVIIPSEEGHSAFMKLGRRKGFTLSIVSVAGFVVTENGKFKDVRVALGAVAPTPMRSGRVEERLRGVEVSHEGIEKAAELVKGELSPISDVRASAEYRREMACVLTRRVLKRLAMGDGKCE